MLTIATSAWAFDEVSLQDGGIVKGEILLLTPGEKVVIQVPGEDEPRTIAWSEVSDVQRDGGGKKSSGGDDTAHADDVESQATAEAEAGVVRVHIESDKPVELIEVTGAARGTTAYGSFVVIGLKSLCASPCDKVVDGSDGHKFFISGDGVPSSSGFALQGYTGNVQVDVDAGSSALRYGGGYTLMALGGAGVVGGATMLSLGLIGDSNSDLTPVGGALLGGGALLLGGGIAMWILGDTNIEVSQRTDEHGRLQPREPNWLLGEF